MLLARTMSVAFIPGVLVAGVLTMLLRGRDDLPNRLLNLGLLILTGVLVAATWYWNNLKWVIEYLTDFGYGGQAHYYGEDHSLLSWDRWRTVAERIAGDDLLAPMIVLVIVALVATAVAVARQLRASPDRRAELERLGATDAFAVLLIVAAGYAALTS